MIDYDTVFMYWVSPKFAMEFLLKFIINKYYVNSVVNCNVNWWNPKLNSLILKPDNDTNCCKSLE